jgi:hypothetical protein
MFYRRSGNRTVRSRAGLAAKSGLARKRDASSDDAGVPAGAADGSELGRAREPSVTKPKANQEN